MTNQHWDTWIDWDNANGAAMDYGRYEPGSMATAPANLSLAPGSVNHAYDPRYWHAEHLPATVEPGLTYWLGPGLILLSRFVLPILGCGNDP